VVKNFIPIAESKYIRFDVSTGLMLRILVFWVVCWTAWLTEPTILKALFSFETSGSVNHAAQHHNTLYECKNVCFMTKRPNHGCTALTVCETQSNCFFFSKTPVLLGVHT
jgi:hypothetical protein